MNIVLIGDSIFDNASYVGESESVSDLIQKFNSGAKVSLLAVDGDTTTGVYKQLKKLPSSTDCVFVSYGGNDALNSISILEQEANSVGDALDVLYKAIQHFRLNYAAMLDAILEKHKKLAVCTIYNKVPGLEQRAYTALALFNEVILEELSFRNLPIIDLRVLLNEDNDYSSISPIEPSLFGGSKIARCLLKVIGDNFLPKIYT